MITFRVCPTAPDALRRTRSGAQETCDGFPLLRENLIALFRPVFSSPVATPLVTGVRGYDVQRDKSAIHDYFRELP
ncbi:MAG: hypothetical protein ACPL7J_03360 [Desulfomonilaceae bacterium]